jgi:hypothetical protein
MKNIRLIAAAACLLLPLMLGACQKEEAAAVVDQPVPMPTTNDDNAWGAYLTDVVKRNMEDTSTSPYVYVLPAPESADFQGYYDRQLEKAKGDIDRGMVEGTMIAFGSPNSTKTADLAIASFGGSEAGKLKGVRVLFIGSPADSDRVKAAVEPSGATYKFVEAK